ncbi:MAG TPA: archease [bacterium (Candidatus Stahlbacteria)]|nr:archease [Candidatus Stahlbacteria bacterium]
MRYKFLDDLTSDVMFEAYGETLEEVLENAALAMFSVVCDIKRVRPLRSMRVEVSSKDEKSLLHNWLSKLLTDSEIEGLFLSKFNIHKIERNDNLHLYATASGEEASPEKGGTVVKGVTYYGLKLEKIRSGYRAQVALDI